MTGRNLALVTGVGRTVGIGTSGQVTTVAPGGHR